MDEGPVHPVRALWAVPRSASTAFERMVIERGDHHVLDEPFSAAYYHGPERRSPRYPVSEPSATVARIVADVDRAARREPVFVKDMAYHPGPELDRALSSSWCHSFLVRDPRWSIPSMARIWPDLTEEEAGFTALARAVDWAPEAGGDPVVINSDDLCRDPAGIVEAWCAAMDLDPDPTALRWEPGMRPEWERWRDWYGASAESTGFAPLRAGGPPTVDDPRLRDLIEASLPLYAELAANCVSPRSVRPR